jgi:MoaA/NifB/PqqE/SkfB family radical SAM enzyme
MLMTRIVPESLTKKLFEEKTLDVSKKLVAIRKRIEMNEETMKKNKEKVEEFVKLLEDLEREKQRI